MLSYYTVVPLLCAFRVGLRADGTLLQSSRYSERGIHQRDLEQYSSIAIIIYSRYRVYYIIYQINMLLRERAYV